MTDGRKKPVEVSIIIPCYNEENTITLLLEAIYKQNYPKEKIEVVIADSLSEDGTLLKIQEFAMSHQDLQIRVIDNPQRTIPAAVNAAVEYAEGEFIVRMDAHSVPEADYIRHSIALLKEGKAQNVGGIWEIEPGAPTCMAAAIARAAAHPLGAGDASYRIKGTSSYVDTVPFGAFRRQDFLELGKFNEKMLANEDYEFNTRLRKAGGKIWMDNRIRSTYFARKSIGALAKQYWRYGYWKFKMLKEFPESIRWRQALPPLFTLYLIILCLLSFFNQIAFIILITTLGFYLFVLVAASIYESIRRKNACYLLMPLAFMTMHITWGSGFLYSIFR